MIGPLNRRWWALIALLPVSVAFDMDMNVLTLAMPTLSVSLHATTSELQWFVAAYNLAMAAGMLPAGLLGDRFGRKKVLLLALVAFGFGSIATAFATSSSAMVMARAFMGMAAAFSVPLALANLPVLFTESAERQRAFMVFMIVNTLGLSVGPILGGWILSRFWWGWVFLMNVPLVALGIAAVAFWLPESQMANRSKVDYIGTLLASAGLVGLTYATIDAGQSGWGHAGIWVVLAIGALLLVAFALWEARRTDGLVDLRLFRSANFTWGTILSTLVMFALAGVTFCLPQYFQEVVGTTVLGNGLRQLPLVGGLIVGGLTAQRLSKLFGAKLAVAVGFVLMAVGLAWATITRVHSGYDLVAGWLAVSGCGLGFAAPATIGAALGALSAEHAGVGSAVLQAVRQVGGTLGIAVLGAVLNSVYLGQIAAARLPQPLAAVAKQSVISAVQLAGRLHSDSMLVAVRTAFMHSMDSVTWVGAGIAVLCIALTLLFLPKDPVAHSEG